MRKHSQISLRQVRVPILQVFEQHLLVQAQHVFLQSQLSYPSAGASFLLLLKELLLLLLVSVWNFQPVKGARVLGSQNAHFGPDIYNVIHAEIKQVGYICIQSDLIFIVCI